MVRFKAMLAVRAPTIASVTQKNTAHPGQLRVAKSIPT